MLYVSPGFCIFLLVRPGIFPVRDPVGGKDACPQVKEDLDGIGMTDVTLKLYPGDRHEILNELDRETVYKDLYGWFEEKKQGKK